METAGLTFRTVQVFRCDPVPRTLNAARLTVMGEPMGGGADLRRPAMPHELALRSVAREAFGAWARLKP